MTRQLRNIYISGLRCNYSVVKVFSPFLIFYFLHNWLCGGVTLSTVVSQQERPMFKCVSFSLNELNHRLTRFCIYLCLVLNIFNDLNHLSVT